MRQPRKVPQMSDTERYIPAPPDCRFGGCRQADVQLSFCALVCVAATYAHREDGKDLFGVGVGSGLEAELSLAVGSSTFSSTGWSLAGSCSADLGVGYYVGGSGSMDPGINTIGPTFSPPSSSSGVVHGAGAGCSGTLNYQTEASWPSW